ncbi:unnamed protein product [Orchesella dallaii]|uniref:Uncharacterized protein n=1 Tax=Orchesella dallaii TaxID=48710 RepID=A0ABP1R863_9HEXA
MIWLSICGVFIVTLALAFAATPNMYWYRPGEPTLADVDDFNRTVDVEFVKEAINAGIDLELVIKLAHLGSMRTRKQRLQILETLKERHSIVNGFVVARSACATSILIFKLIKSQLDISWRMVVPDTEPYNPFHYPQFLQHTELFYISSQIFIPTRKYYITDFSMIRLSICGVFIVTLALAFAATPEMYRYRPGEPTLADHPDFNRTTDADFVMEAINAGIDMEFMIKLAHLGSMRSRKQRLQILETLKEIHSIDLVTMYLSRENFEGSLGVLIRGLFMPRAEFLAMEVRWAIDGLGTDENTLTDVFCCLDREVAAYSDIDEAYTRLYPGDRLSFDVVTEESGANQYTGELLGMERKFSEFFGLSSFDEINRTANYYKELHHGKTTLNFYLDEVTSYSSYWFLSPNYLSLLVGNLHERIMAIINYSTDKTGYFEDLIVNALKEEDYRRITRAIVLQADDGLELVKERYLQNHGGSQTLVTFAHDKFLHARTFGYGIGSYSLRMLLKILCGNINPERDLDLVSRWDKTKKCAEDDINCGFSEMCYEPPIDPFEALELFFIVVGSNHCWRSIILFWLGISASASVSNVYLSIVADVVVVAWSAIPH